jgi:hypothetical protein
MSLLSWKFKRVKDKIINHPATSFIALVIVIALILYCGWHCIIELRKSIDTQEIIEFVSLPAEPVSSSNNTGELCDALLVSSMNTMLDITIKITLVFILFMLSLKLVSCMCSMMFRKF